jgi:hypothetical protein
MHISLSINILIEIRSQSYTLEIVSLSKTTSFTILEGVLSFRASLFDFCLNVLSLPRLPKTPRRLVWAAWVAMPPLSTSSPSLPVPPRRRQSVLPEAAQSRGWWQQGPSSFVLPSLLSSRWQFSLTLVVVSQAADTRICNTVDQIQRLWHSTGQIQRPTPGFG